MTIATHRDQGEFPAPEKNESSFELETVHKARCRCVTQSGMGACASLRARGETLEEAQAKLLDCLKEEHWRQNDDGTWTCRACVNRAANAASRAERQERRKALSFRCIEGDVPVCANCAHLNVVYTGHDVPEESYYCEEDVFQHHDFWEDDPDEWWIASHVCAAHKQEGT